MKSVSNLKKWVNDEYAKVDGDPWGLDWRPTQQYRYSHVIEAINTHINKDGLMLADIGCATGIFTNYIHQNYKNTCAIVKGVDISSVAIERAREKYPDLEFIVSDIKNFSENYKGTQDVVICLETLYYIEPDKRNEAILQLLAALKNDGYLVISSLNSKPPYLSKNELIDLLSDFKIVEVSEINVKPIIKLERVIIKIDRLLLKLGIKFNALKNLFRFIFPHKVIKFISDVFKRMANKSTTSHILAIAQRKH